MIRLLAPCLLAAAVLVPLAPAQDVLTFDLPGAPDEVQIDGDLLAVSYEEWPHDPVVRIWSRSAGAWSFEKDITNSQPGFGHAIALSDERLAIGYADAAGRVRIHERSPQGNWPLSAVLTEPGDPWYGYYIALEGDWLAVRSVARVYLYERTAPGTWTKRLDLASPQNHTLAVQDGTLVFGHNDRVRIYEPNGPGWSLVANLVAPPGERFSRAEIEDRLLAIATDQGGCTTQEDCPVGGVLVYRDIAGTWTHVQTLHSSNYLRESFEGVGLAVSGGRILSTTGGSFGGYLGAGYLYVPEGGNWSQHLRFSSWAGQNAEYFGGRGDMSGEDVAITRLIPPTVFVYSTVTSNVEQFCYGGPCPCLWSVGHTGCQNSASVGYFAAGAAIEYQGSTSVAADDLKIQVHGLPNQPAGLILGNQLTETTLGNGRLCVDASQASRWPATWNSQPPGVGTGIPGHLGGSGTTQQFGPGLVAQAGQQGLSIQAGQTWYFQAWYFDPQDCLPFNTSSALAVTFTP